MPGKKKPGKSVKVPKKRKKTTRTSQVKKGRRGY